METLGLAFAILLLAVIAFSVRLRAEDHVTADERFGEWKMKCAISEKGEPKGCSIWVGPTVARSNSQEEITLTFLVQPNSADATVITRSDLFVQFRVDESKAFFADCTDAGICQLPTADARNLLDQMYRGRKLLIRVAESKGTFDRAFELSGYKTSLDTYLDQERTYEIER